MTTFEERFRKATLEQASVEPTADFTRRVVRAVRLQALLSRWRQPLRAVAAVAVLLPGSYCLLFRGATPAEQARRYLAQCQGADGAWHPEHFDGQAAYQPALTALAALCLDAESTKYHDQINKAIAVIVQKPQLSASTQVEAYNQALTAFALVSLGQTGRYPELGPQIRHVLDAIKRTQQASGGWTYENQNDGNTALSTWHVRTLALAGDPACQESLKKGLRWLQRHRRADGSFQYAEKDLTSTPTLDAMAACAFQTAGLQELAQTSTIAKEAFTADYYRQYFAISALRSAGKNASADRLRDELVRLQRDGKFSPDHQWSRTGGGLYAVTFALLSI